MDVHAQLSQGRKYGTGRKMALPKTDSEA